MFIRNFSSYRVREKKTIKNTLPFGFASILIQRSYWKRTDLGFYWLFQRNKLKKKHQLSSHGQPQRYQSINQSINRASTVMCTAVMDQSSNSGLDWMSTVMHGAEYWGRGLIVPCGRDGTVRQWRTITPSIYTPRRKKSMHCNSSYFGKWKRGTSNTVERKRPFFPSCLSFRKKTLFKKKFFI